MLNVSLKNKGTHENGSRVAAEFSALADVLRFFLFDQDGYQFLFHTGNGDECLGKLLNNPPFLVARETLFLFEYDNRHEYTTERVGWTHI